MKVRTLCVLLVLIVALFGTAVADITQTDDMYYYLGPPLNAAAGDYDPDVDDPNAIGWNLNFLPGPPPAGTIPPGQVLVLAQRNLQRLDQWKYVTVNVQYAAASALLTYDRMGYDGRDHVLFTHTVLRETDDVGPPRNYLLGVRIMPQPDWEWIELKATSPSPIVYTRATINSVCLPFPSTTNAGLTVLVLLLGGTAAWIIRHRRTHAAP